MRRLVAGEAEISDALAAELLDLAARDRAKKTLELVAYLQREHGAPAQISLTEGRDDVGRRATRIVVDALRARGVKVTIVPIEGDERDPAKRARRAAERRGG